MASTSGSKRPPSRPPSPPPPPPRRVRRQRKQVSQEEEEEEVEVNKLFMKKTYPHRDGKDIYEVPDNDLPPETSEEAKRRHVSVQDYQELNRAKRDELQFAAYDIFLSNNPLRCISLVSNFTKSSIFDKNDPQSQAKELWNFCARRYPNALSLMLARLLNSPDLPHSTCIYAVKLLHLTLNRIHGQDPSRIDERVLSHLKSLLHNVIHNHESIPNMLNLSEIVARMFETERWSELLDDLLNALRTDFEKRQEMALRVLLILPEEECDGAYKFWRANYKSLYFRFFHLFDSPNLNIQVLTFDASVKLMCLLKRWGFHQEIEYLLIKMILLLLSFHKDGQIDILEQRIMDLVHLARYYTDYFLKRLDVVLGCMFEIAVTAGDNSFLKCQAIEIIKILEKKALISVSNFLLKLPKEAKRSILENCVRLMFCIADVPRWYDMDTASSEYMGISGSYELGKFLLFRLCLHSQEDILVSFGIEMIPQYLNSEDWRTRHAGLIAFAAIGSACGSVMVRDQADRVLDISLTDPHPRVRWAAIEAIRFSTTDSDHRENVQYLAKFVPRLVTIIRSSSMYPRIQFHAAIVVRRLIVYCDDEDVKSFSEDLVLELLKFLKQGEKFRDEAMEILKSLAESFPASFCWHYRQTVDSLKPFVSQSLLGAKTIEYLSYIFSGFLSDQSLFLLSDAQEVVLMVLRIVNNWTRTDRGVKIHILKALSQLCKLPQLVAEHFLNPFMPMLIQILEKTNPTMPSLNVYIGSTSTIKNEQISTCPELRPLACNLLSKFADRFKEQFAPWAAKVCPLLMVLFSSTDVETKIASVKALPSLLHSCQHIEEPQRLMFTFTVQALVQALLQETKRANTIVMLKSLNACIAISGSDIGMDVIKQIVNLIYQLVLSHKSFANIKKQTGGGESSRGAIARLEQEEGIIQAAKCLETMICTLKSDFLTHVDELLPTVEALLGRENDYPDKVKAAAISIFNLILKDNPDKLQRYRDIYARVVMHFCYSESPELQQEAARGIGLCATHRELISNFDAHAAIDSLYHVIECALESERTMTYDAAVSALGKICEFWRDTINGPQVVPIWLNCLPLRNDFEEAKYAHQQLCRMLERVDRDLLGLNNENLDKTVRTVNEILLQSDSLNN